MKCLINAGSAIRVIKTVVLLTALASPAVDAYAQTPACSWPQEITGTGDANLYFPDTNATYWVMPFDPTKLQTMTIKGTYPEARFFSFTTYPATGSSVIASIIDANIAPNYGSSNPFATPAPPAANPGASQYSITVSATNPGSGNYLKVLGSGVTVVVYRVYVPDHDLDREGGVKLPDVTITTSGGQTSSLMPCPLAEVTTTALSAEAAATLACSSAMTFVSQSGSGIFPNPVTTYYRAENLCLQPGQVVVVRARAPVFPDTYNGGTIFQPAIPGVIQMRYWSMCTNDETEHRPVVTCQPDHATKLDGDGFFTYVMSNDQYPPSWLPSDVTWLPWGATTIPKALVLRNMLPVNFTLSGDYFPQGAFCDKKLFIESGWQACFAAAPQ
jgi:hypothetical protein